MNHIISEALHHKQAIEIGISLPQSVYGNNKPPRQHDKPQGIYEILAEGRQILLDGLAAIAISTEVDMFAD